MTGLFTVLIVVGIVCCVAAAAWAMRTRHVRAVWKSAGRDTRKTAILLELEERVREIESSAR